MKNNKVTLTFIVKDPSKPFEFRGKTYTSKTKLFRVEVKEEEADSVIEESRKTSDYDLAMDSRHRFNLSSVIYTSPENAEKMHEMFKEEFEKRYGK